MWNPYEMNQLTSPRYRASVDSHTTSVWSPGVHVIHRRAHVSVHVPTHVSIHIHTHVIHPHVPVHISTHVVYVHPVHVHVRAHHSRGDVVGAELWQEALLQFGLECRWTYLHLYGIGLIHFDIQHLELTKMALRILSTFTTISIWWSHISRRFDALTARRNLEWKSLPGTKKVSKYYWIAQSIPVTVEEEPRAAHKKGYRGATSVVGQ